MCVISGQQDHSKSKTSKDVVQRRWFETEPQMWVTGEINRAAGMLQRNRILKFNGPSLPINPMMHLDLHPFWHLGPALGACLGPPLTRFRIGSQSIRDPIS